MIVDCHTHVSGGDGAVDESAHLEAVEPVDVSFVLASPDGKSEEMNKAVGRYVGKHSGKTVGFAVVNPIEDAINAKSLAGATEKLGLEGVVLYCSRGAYHPAHSRAMRFYESVRDLKLPVFFHNFAEGPQAVLEYAQPHLIDEVAREFPEIRIVIGNMGIPFYQQTIWMVGKHKNVFADLTIRPGKVWQVFNIVTAAHEQGVMDKLLFGSGYPAAAPGECMEALLGFNKLMSEAKLPVVPRGSIRDVIDRDTLEVLGIDHPAASSEKSENLG